MSNSMIHIKFGILLLVLLFATAIALGLKTQNKVVAYNNYQYW